MIRVIFIFTAFLTLASCNKPGAGKNYLFDMGPDMFPPEKGFIHIGLSGEYDSVKGYGWLHAPVAAFDTVNSKLHRQSLCSGVWGKDSLVFRVDAEDGDYDLIITLGNKDSVKMDMQVSVNDVSAGSRIIVPWYRLSYKTLRTRCSVTQGKIAVRIKGNGTDVGVYAIELRAIPDRVTIREGLEQDTAMVRQFRSELAADLKKDTTDISLLNQLDLVDKYLLACYYYDGGGWSWASKETGFSLIYRMYAAADLLEQITADPSDPLYERSLYLLGRIYYWLDKEDNNSAHEKKAAEIFAQLKERYPDNKIIRMYLGEQVANDEYKPSMENADAPEWAIYQQEAMSRMLDLIQWWVLNRQAPNGELGGKYGDDVEILRWWLPAVLGADDSLARIGYTRLADGVWNSGILERGFAKRVDDVEHSAELFRDTHPGMFLVKYGDPEYVERCLISMQNFRDVWTGITSFGHRHFRSYYLSATAIVPQYPYGVDVALNARALLPGLWAAWYSGNASLMQLFDEWCRAWVEDAARVSNGKPAGVLPSAVAFDGDKIGGDSKQWYNPGLTYDYYDWDHLGHVNELQYHLLGMYKITGNDYFLRTVNFYNELILEARRQSRASDTATSGTLEWVKTQLLNGGADRDPVQHPMGKLLGMAAQLTGRPDYDSLLLQYGYPYARYQLTHDTAIIISGLKDILATLRYNRPLLTSEVKFTDRVYIPGSNLLMGMYTGHFGAGYEYPALAVSWKNTGRDVAVFLQRGSSKAIYSLLYNFGKKKEIGIRTWQLEPGVYRMRLGIDRDNNGVEEEMVTDINVELNERVNDMPLTVPSGRNLILSIEQVRRFESQPSIQPDLAISAGDITAEVKDGQIMLSALVHNIGNGDARNIRVSCVAGQDKQTMEISLLQAPNDLHPQSKPVIFWMKPFTGTKKFTVLIESVRPEITSLNNSAEATVIMSGGELRVSF